VIAAALLHWPHHRDANSALVIDDGHCVELALGFNLTPRAAMSRDLVVDAEAFNLVDYGCGQGLAGLLLFDHLAS
jgi:hypothetical protein